VRWALAVATAPSPPTTTLAAAIPPTPARRVSRKMAAALSDFPGKLRLTQSCGRNRPAAEVQFSGRKMAAVCASMPRCRLCQQLFRLIESLETHRSDQWHQLSGGHPICLK
jgi:hypothetical protein